jgi:hypothetical protein
MVSGCQHPFFIFWRNNVGISGQISAVMTEVLVVLLKLTGKPMDKT